MVEWALLTVVVGLVAVAATDREPRRTRWIGRMTLLAGAAVFAVVARAAWDGALGGVTAVQVLGAGMAWLVGRRRVDPAERRAVDLLAKLLFTGVGMVALLRHPIALADGGEAPLFDAVRAHLDQIELGTLLRWSLVAMAVKFCGVVASAFGWNLLLRGQGLRFPFFQQVLTAFLIGRFVGTFLPSTVGLDGYTLYEAGRYSNQWHRVVTAKALEKFIGIAGLFTGLLVTLPAGWFVLERVAGSRAPLLTALVGGVSGGVTLLVVAGLAWPVLPRLGARFAARWLPAVIGRQVARFADASTAYEGRLGLLLAALLAKFVTHFSTAIVYFFTALAIGVVGVEFLPIVFGSLLQILGTLFSPTIAGEGAREALQALLLTSYLGGAAQAVLSAALGFVAAEAATLWGGAFLLTRSPSWRPRFVHVDGKQVDYAWLEDEAALTGGTGPMRGGTLPTA